MSGGSYDYFCWKVSELDVYVDKPAAMARDIRQCIDREGPRQVYDRELSKWRDITKEERLELHEAASMLDAISARAMAFKAAMMRFEDLLHSVEWCMSGDTGLDDIMRAYRALTEPKEKP